MKKYKGWNIAALILLTLMQSTATAKLFSSSVQEDRAKEEIDRVFRETRLNDGSSFWGDQHQDEIERYKPMFKTNYYSIFADMKIEGAIARCIVNAKNQNDYEEWIRRMDLFDRAAMELDQRDRARYFFAKGLAILQAIPSKLREVPPDFYRAAEFGQPSELWSDFVVRSGSESVSIGTQRISDVLRRFGESYSSGGFHAEAYKMYILALKYAGGDTDLFLKLIESAERGGSHVLAYKSSLLLLTVFDLHGGMRISDRAPLDSLKLSAKLPAVDIWKLCEAGGVIEAAVAVGALTKTPSKTLDERQAGRFDSRIVQPVLRSLGMYEDLFKISLCEKYWSDSVIVAIYAPRVGGSLDAFDGAVGRLARRIREDARFNQSRILAQWEAKRWKDAKRYEEFLAQFPERAALAGL